MAIWTSEIKELERLYESPKGQLPDLEKELERLIMDLHIHTFSVKQLKE